MANFQKERLGPGDFPLEAGSHASLVRDDLETELKSQAGTPYGANTTSSHVLTHDMCWVVDEPDLELVDKTIEVDQQVSVLDGCGFCLHDSDGRSAQTA